MLPERRATKPTSRLHHWTRCRATWAARTSPGQPRLQEAAAKVTVVGRVAAPVRAAARASPRLRTHDDRRGARPHQARRVIQPVTVSWSRRGCRQVALAHLRHRQRERVMMQRAAAPPVAAAAAAARTMTGIAATIGLRRFRHARACGRVGNAPRFCPVPAPSPRPPCRPYVARTYHPDPVRGVPPCSCRTGRLSCQLRHRRWIQGFLHNRASHHTLVVRWTRWDRTVCLCLRLS